MKLRSIVIPIVALALGAVAPAQVTGPILGYVPDASASAVRPIWGIAGASVTGQVIDAGLAMSRVAISPRQDYWLAVAGADQHVVLAVPGRSGVTVSPLTDAGAGPDQIIVSPEGTAAALYFAGQSRVQVFTGLPAAAALSWTADLTPMAAAPGALALSDDGLTLLAASENEGAAALYLLGPDGGVNRLPLDSPALSAAFLHNRSDAVLAGASGVLLLRDAAANARLEVLVADGGVARPAGVAVSQDNRRAFIADSAHASVLALDLGGAGFASIPCGCALTGLFPMNAPGVFRLTDVSAGPIVLLNASSLDTGSSDAPILVVPPAPSTEVQQ